MLTVQLEYFDHQAGQKRGLTQITLWVSGSFGSVMLTLLQC